MGADDAAGTDHAAGALRAFGVDALGHRVYRALLRAGSTPLEPLCGLAGADRSAVVARVRQLADLGLVHLTAGAAVPRPPRLALGRLLDEEARRLLHRETELNELRQSIPAFLAEEGAQTAEALRGELVVYTEDQLVPVLDELVRGTTGVMRFLHSPEWLANDAGTTRADLTIGDEERSGREVRAVYPHAALEIPRVAASLRAYAADGELVRLHPGPPSRLAVFGDQAALVPVQWGQLPTHRVVVRSRGVVAALSALFDSVWARSTPLIRPGRDDRSAVLRLLAGGAKDETIARQLGLSLRTVRRRIAEVMDDLDVTTRFAAGVEAARRGMV